MLRLSKKADCGLIAVKHLATHRDGACSASEIAEASGISGPLMAKVMQKLARGGLVMARHGSGGGYQAPTCSVREPLRRVNDSILQILKAVTISQMSEDSCEHALVDLSS
jgi:DNA-binding IscR family transcriptional regulator